MKSQLVLLILCLITVSVRSGPVSQDESMLRSFVEPFMKCQNSDYYTCGKEEALKAVDKLRTLRQLKIYDGVTLLNSNPKQGRSLESLSDDVTARRQQVSERLWQSTSDILQNGELELTYPDNDEEDEESRSIDEAEEGRGKKKKALKKKLKILIPLIILAKAKAAAIVVLSLVVIAASVFKIALLAKIAFVIKMIALIKAILAKKYAHEEAWESHAWEPHVEHVHPEPSHGWEGGWSRSKAEANNIAYSAYNK